MFKKGLAIIIFQYKRILEARTHILIDNIQSAFALFLIFYFWKGIYQNQTEINGYSFSQIVTYYFLVRVLYNRVSTFQAQRTANDIKLGEINKYLAKPLGYITYVFFNNNTAGNLWSLGNLISILLYSAFLYNFLLLPSNVINGVFFLVIFFLNGAISTFINLIIGFVAFWTGEAAHIKLATTQIMALLSGALIPLNYYPDNVRKILDFLPMKYLIQFPTDVYLGKIDYFDISKGILIMLIWTALLYFLATYIFNKGTKVYESYN